MRPLERIPKIINIIHELWTRNQDLRFNQLITNLQKEFKNKNSQYGRTLYQKEETAIGTTYMKVDALDLYTLEDDKFLIFLEEKLKEDDERRLSWFE